jgi:RNA polymerase sigma-70 factor, ECF subfamily
MTRTSRKQFMPDASPDVTTLLSAWRRGDEAALGQLLPLVHDELHKRARNYMRQERPDHTLRPTALVNEAYLRLVDVRRVDWKDRAHFLAMAARQMRRVLVDAGRRRRFQKRGGGVPNVTFDEDLVLIERGPDLEALDDALDALAIQDERKARVVELRFFGGLNNEEAAEALGVSTDTVMRDWKVAKLWLLRELKRRSRAS